MEQEKPQFVQIIDAENTNKRFVVKISSIDFLGKLLGNYLVGISWDPNDRAPSREN